MRHAWSPPRDQTLAVVAPQKGRAMAAKAGVRPSQSSEPSDESSESGGEPEERVAVEAEAYLYDAAKSHIVSEEGG